MVSVDGSVATSLKRRLALAVLMVLACGLLSAPSYAGRLIATPAAPTLPEGKYSLWQFLILETKTTDNVRLLNRIDVGLTERLEAGVFVINPPNKPTDTWLNLQFKVLDEGEQRPVVSVGVWDATEIKEFCGGEKDASFFIAAGKTLRPTVGSWKPPYLKPTIAVGTNRLNGLFGGFDLRICENTGILAEYAPSNLRLPRGTWLDAGVYHWFGPHWRGRVSYLGGNPMADFFYTHTIGK
ncbi:MAG: hypothetical protein PVH68_14650 [Armatimonadota bacterium]|jgi:hypothetical protein